MKKIRLFLMLMLLFAASQNSHAYDVGSTFKIEGITYKVTDIANREVQAIGIETDEANVTIPATVQDGIDQEFTVKSVGNWAETWSKKIVTLTIAEGIESIASGAAFCSAEGLETIHLPKSLKHISPVAFARLSKLKEITVEKDNPYFCSEAGVLYNKTKAEVIRYPNNKEIGTDGVYSIPNGVVKVWAGAYANNKGLKEVHVPASVSEFQTGTYDVFSSCTNLTDIIVDKENLSYKDIDGVLCDYDKTLITYPEGKDAETYTVPDGIERIETNCFYQSKFKEVSLNNVKEISASGFINCTQLTTINISESVATIKEGGFKNCTAITKYAVDDNNTNYSDIDGVLCNKGKTTLLQFPIGRTGDYTIPESITKIADDSFYGSRLGKVTISKNVETIGKEAFRLSKNLACVEFEEPSSVTLLDTYCFWSCASLTTITLPASLKTINGNAFLNCPKLKTVFIEDGSQLETIAGGAFADCTVLTDFTFKGSCTLETIGDKAFARNPKLRSFAFPASVTTIGSSAFSGCTDMTTATFADNAVITSIGRNAFDGCGLESIEIPSSVITIEAEAFKNCTLLESVAIPESTTSINPEAFKFCTSLTRIDVAEGNTAYSSVDGILLSKDKETLMIFPAGKANDKFTLLPPSITKIGDYAFYNCENLTNVTIPNKVTAIGDRAFGLCPNLNTMTFLCDEMISPADIDQELNTKSFDDSMFGNISINVRKEKLEEYKGEEFYRKFKSIAPSFMSGNDNEEYIAVSDNAVDMLSTKNTDYTYILPSEVTHGDKTYSVALIGDYAFQGVGGNMKEVVVPKSISYIGAKAFKTDIDNDASTIESIFFLGTDPGAEALSTLRFNLDDTGKDYDEFADMQKIYVKKSAVAAYRAAWLKHAKAIDYRIPGISITTKYGTFAREFDTYIGEYAESEADGACVMAFIGGEYRKGNGDYGPETEYHVHMESIEAAGYDGFYIPKNTGVLLKVMDAEATPNDFYYCIGEKDDTEHNVATNAMKGVTINNTQISGYDKWVIQSGQFRALNGQTATMPVHKAYLQLEGASAAARVTFSFDDDSTTGITCVDADNGADADYYNLSGMRVDNPQKGVYIRNGRKTVIK